MSESLTPATAELTKGRAEMCNMHVCVEVRKCGSGHVDKLINVALLVT